MFGVIRMYDANDIINIRLGRCEESGIIIIEIECDFPIEWEIDGSLHFTAFRCFAVSTIHPPSSLCPSVSGRDCNGAIVTI